MAKLPLWGRSGTPVVVIHDSIWLQSVLNMHNLRRYHFDCHRYLMKARYRLAATVIWPVAQRQWIEDCTAYPACYFWTSVTTPRSGWFSLKILLQWMLHGPRELSDKQTGHMRRRTDITIYVILLKLSGKPYREIL